jgi:hypothetical protein
MRMWLRAEERLGGTSDACGSSIWEDLVTIPIGAASLIDPAYREKPQCAGTASEVKVEAGSPPLSVNVAFGALGHA